MEVVDTHRPAARSQSASAHSAFPRGRSLIRRLNLPAAMHNENPAVLMFLIEAGADMKAQRVDGSTPLHFAAQINNNPEVLPIFINAGADVNAKNDDGGTPLDWAIAPLFDHDPKPKNAEVLRAAGGKRGEDFR